MFYGAKPFFNYSICGVILVVLMLFSIKRLDFYDLGFES